MKITARRVLCVVLCLVMLLGVAVLGVACGKKPAATAKTYTYKSYSSALGTNWNPHTWEMNSDDLILSYVSSPFVTMSIKDSENGVYQWVYEMATEVTDVTKEHQSDLTKYKVTLQSGKTPETTESGYVFEIKLNPNAKWENGVAIKADDYIYSMKQLLDSKMKNYRANLYWQGESAVAGGYAYYNSESPLYTPVVPPYDEEEPDYSFDIENNDVYIDLKTQGMTLAGYSFFDIAGYGYIDADVLTKMHTEMANAYGFIKVTPDNKAQILDVMDQYLSAFGMSIYANEDKTEIETELYMEFLYAITGVGDKVDYDEAVGCYKVDDYTIRYVTETYIDFNYFMTSLTSTWLVYEPLYEAGKDTTGELVTTNYGTSKETTMSYGTYKMETFEADKQVVFVQNPEWYGFEKAEDGSLISYTNFEVDGKKVQQYQTTKIIIDVMTDATAKEKFLKGELSEWAPESDDLVKYSTSDRMYKVDETYTMSLFFDTNVEDLKKMDASEGNTNSVVLSNVNFRKAFSLSIDRANWVSATAGYKPAYAIMNNLYYYDVYNDPTTSYRRSDAAMQAICNLYGVEYGEGKAYATLKDAYDSINGYNLTEAKALMKTACDELVAAGLYTAGQDIVIRMGWKKGALESSDNQQVTLLNNYINAAAADSGFGHITLDAIGNVEDRYGDVGTRGTFAIGYGARGGAAFYPFRNFQVYMDPDNTDIHEGRCWDPTTEVWTLTVNGEEVSMTCQDWSNALIGTGAYSEASNEVKLSVTAQLEQKFLEKYYRIPLAGSTVCSLLSFQLNYYTEEYNIMYDFGGLRLMTYNYDDEAWANYVASQNGTLKYE
ncbi:MAG: ABC transporter substrate-binding protein [Clostridia bacterium]|nr:ABC transporter substrate-binding protein [Clostridia bacterium]